MTKEELRIGNLIDTYHGWAQVTQIGEVIYYTPNKIGSTHGSILSPIPITKEVLNRCIFKEGFGVDTYADGFVFWEMRESESWHDEQQGERQADIKAVKYLHQLQNIYFFITDEELTIIIIPGNDAS